MKITPIKYYLLILSLTLLSNLLQAQQQTLKGKIVNKDKEPLEFVEAVLLKNDTIYVEGVATDSMGYFSFKVDKDSYRLVLEYFGEKHFNEIIDLNQDLDIGEIEIDEAVSLEEMIITARKKLIERKVDRLIFNVENSVQKSGTNALEVLANTPLVVANQTGVNMVGKGNVQVMINDRIIQLSNKDLPSFLQTLASDDISKVEVITSPPSKYEAEGNSGIINIVTKKNITDVFSGSFTTSFTKNSKESYYNNLNLNYNNNRFQTSLKLRGMDRNAKAYENQNVLFQTDGNALYNHTDRIDNSKNYGANLDLAYKMTENNTIGVVYDFGKSRNVYESLNKTSYYSNQLLDSLLITNSHYKNPTTVHTLSLYNDLVIDTLGSKISFVANYLSNTPKTSLDYITNTADTTKVTNTSLQKYDVYSAQLDFLLRGKWADIETGIKYTLFDNSSDIRYYHLVDSQYELDPNQSNVFELNEHNYAAYLSLNKKFNEHWTVKAGLRYEYTILESLSISDDNNIKTDYGRLFPNFNLLYSTENHTYTFNYSSRINRPRIGQLNPFRWYSNPFVYIVGNPYLKPSISHNIEFNYLYKGMLLVNVFGSRQNNAFGSLINIEDGIKETKISNIYTLNNIGASLAFSDNIISIWNLYLNAAGFYSYSDSDVSQVTPLKGWSANYSINNTFTVIEKNSGIIFLNFRHTLPGTESNVKSKSLTNVTVGGRINFFDNKLTIDVRANDIFKGEVSKGNLIYNDFNQYYDNYYDNRNFTISVTYNFGTNRSSNRKIEFNEKYRAN